MGGRGREIAMVYFSSYSMGVSDKPFIIIIHGYYYQVLICSGSQGTFFFHITWDKYCVFNLD